MEQELRLFRGEWPSVWLEDGWKNWKLRLVTVVLAEASALTQDAKVKYAELEFESANMAEQKSKAESRLSKLKDVTTSVYFTAKEQLEKNSVRFTWKKFSEAAVHKKRLLEHAFGKCAKCRWQSGCLDCNAFKCLRYHLHSEAAKAHKLPHLSTIPEDLEQLLKTPSTSSSSAAPSTSSSSAAPSTS